MLFSVEGSVSTPNASLQLSVSVNQLATKSWSVSEIGARLMRPEEDTMGPR